MPKPPPASAEVPIIKRKACAYCGATFSYLRSQARFCGAPCRSEAHRVKLILRGQPIDGHHSLHSYLMARPRATRALHERVRWLALEAAVAWEVAAGADRAEEAVAEMEANRGILPAEEAEEGHDLGGGVNGRQWGRNGVREGV